MEKSTSSILCPVCSLYLREGISLKTHLQTHSKEKVIEALLNSQDGVHFADNNIDNETTRLHIQSNSISHDNTTISIAENRFITSLNRSTVSISPSSSPYIQPSNDQITQTTQSFTIDSHSVQNNNNVQYPLDGTSISQTAVGNSCDAVLTYYQFITGDGSIILVPMYNMYTPPVVIPNNVLTTPVVNSCIVVPPSTSEDSLNVNKSTMPLQSSEFHSSVNDQSDCSETFKDCNVILGESNERNAFDSTGNRTEYESVDSVDEEEKATDEEVANIFEMTSQYTECCKESATTMTECSENLDGDLYRSDIISKEDTAVLASPVCTELKDYSQIGMSRNSENTSQIVSDMSNETDSVISMAEKEHYILPNNDIPGSSCISSSSNDSSVGISKNLSSATSVLASVSKITADVNIYTAENSKVNFQDKYELNLKNGIKSEKRKVFSHTTLTNYVMKLTDGNDGVDDVLKNFSDTSNSIGESRISPFNIQTDESMPARGELSGQESLSSTENSLWELQVKQNACVQNYSVCCKNENTDMNVGLHSLITDISIKNDSESVVRKVVREFHCFYCRKKFDTWKLRQVHINEEHANEDGLTIESLFGRKLKFELEGVKNENDEPSSSDQNVLCRICSATFATSMCLLKHLKTVHGIKKRTCICPTCFVHFRTSEEYQEHIQKVHPYECMTCGKKFYTRPGYMLHQKRHMKIKPYSCDVCDKSFVTKQKLGEHINIHTGDSPIKCDLCDSSFKRYSNYQQHKKYLHMNVKRKLKDFICECGGVFHSKMKLMWHQEIHDEKPKQCPFCVERFVHMASLTRHVRKWHNETYLSDWVNKKKIRNVTCPVCNISYLHTSLRTHMKIHEGVKPFSCSECSKTFRTKWNLQLHKWTHMSRSAKPYKCRICVKAYIHKTDYDAHMRSHNNSRPYACNVCGRQFIRKYNCIRHMREHQEPRTHKCNVCEKLFSRSYYLTEHEKVHTGEKPHICHFCGKASATKSNHNKHVKMHTGVRESVNLEG